MHLDLMQALQCRQVRVYETMMVAAAIWEEGHR